jgi:hypothetical protein
MFEAQGELFTEPGYRGCGFVSASAESHPGDLVEQAADAALAENLIRPGESRCAGCRPRQLERWRPGAARRHRRLSRAFVSGWSGAGVLDDGEE